VFKRGDFCQVFRCVIVSEPTSLVHPNQAGLSNDQPCIPDSWAFSIGRYVLPGFRRQTFFIGLWVKEYEESNLHDASLHIPLKAKGTCSRDSHRESDSKVISDSATGTTTKPPAYRRVDGSNARRSKEKVFIVEPERK
jgi:hypothetical protein